MELYIYSDEPGVFDYVHNEYYTYGGLILPGRDLRDNVSRKYVGAEKNISKAYPKGSELKASFVSNKHKNKLYGAVKPCVKFGAVVTQSNVQKNIFDRKESKQRYLDYVYKMALKNAFVGMQNDSIIKFEDITGLNIYVDEHTTATDGLYELRQSLIQEFKHGTFNWNWNRFYPPIFPNLLDVKLRYCNSAKVPLVRAADIVANHLYYLVNQNKEIDYQNHLYVKHFP